MHTVHHANLDINWIWWTLHAQDVAGLAPFVILIAVENVQLDIIPIQGPVVFAHQNAHHALVHQCALAVFKDTILRQQILV